VVSYEIFGEKEEDEVKCLLRYVPDERGERVSERGRFRKLSFSEAYEFLKRHHPEYVKDVHMVPKEDIKEILRPEECLPLIAKREDKVRTIYDLLRKHIPRERIGVTGSFLCGLNGEKSDIDFVVYGRRNFDKAREVIEDAKKTGFISEIKDEIWRRIYDKRKPELRYEDFVAHERRKRNRGMIGNSYFDILYVRDWDEIKHLDRRDYERGERVGYRKIRAEVKDASFSFDNPAIYEVKSEHKHREVNKILSFTHTYAGQAMEGEEIEAKGMMEKTKHEMRLVVGTTREAKGEWIKSLSLCPHLTLPLHRQNES
jgi:hypothetical protein